MAGIVRRLDELGRIVIPKQMRKSMHLEVGDEMQIVYDGETLSIKRVSGLKANRKITKAVARVLCEGVEADACVCDMHTIVGCEGKNKRHYQDAVLHVKFVEILKSRRVEILHGDELKNVFCDRECVCCYAIVEPIVSDGDLLGGIILLLDCLPSDVARAYVHFCATLLGTVL